MHCQRKCVPACEKSSCALQGAVLNCLDQLQRSLCLGVFERWQISLHNASGSCQITWQNPMLHTSGGCWTKQNAKAKLHCSPFWVRYSAARHNITAHVLGEYSNAWNTPRRTSSAAIQLPRINTMCISVRTHLHCKTPPHDVWERP